jgi:two-component system sensor histidine kinase YesM
MSSFLASLQMSNIFFVISLLIIALSGCIIIFALYRSFFRQLLLLIQKFKAVADGNYETRVEQYPNNEFGFLFLQFNKMVQQVETLIQHLSKETELRQDAEFKQLQSQISPHFLYNNLFYIMSMAEQSPHAVITMTNHMAQYYQYMTKKKSQVTVESELDLARHYLEIMSLRKNIVYEIEVDDSIRRQEILPLIVQPIVENAIVHGIEAKHDANRVRITGSELAVGYIITVEDDGRGLSDEELAQLQHKLNANVQPAGSTGIALWNIHHRLQNRFGAQGGVKLAHSPLGGLQVSFAYSKGDDA